MKVMKMKMDLLPTQYKCLPRDWKAIIILIIIRIAIPSTWYGLKYYYDSVLKRYETQSEEEIAELDGRIKKVDTDINELDTQLKTPRIAKDKVKEINERVNFFNRIYQKSFSWYDFFDKIEKLTPPDVWVKDIKVTGGEQLTEQAFEIVCESKEPYHAPQFLKNLMQNKEFVPPDKEQNSVVLSQVIINPAFGYEFSLKFKFYPFKQISSDPEKVIMHVGDKKDIKVFSVNIIDAKRELYPGNYISEVVNITGNAIFDDVNGTLKALAEGKGFLKLMSLDKKFTATMNFEIVK